MAYFDCIVGGGSDGSILTVTCFSGFAGLTIYITNGVDIFSEVCPSTSPYEVVFEGLTNGTWTLSTVYNGVTYTETVEVNLTSQFYPIPDGATATPTDDIQTWLHCADIWNKTYTAIAQVLADASTLQALIASNNAVDYMARSTSWASSVTANSNAMTYIGANNYCANKLLANSTWCNAICNSTYFESVLNTKVPTMTSNTTPSGEASAYNTYPSTEFKPYYAFDNNASTLWICNANGYLQYDFGSGIKTSVNKIQVTPHVYQAGYVKDFIIKGSNDNVTYTDIFSGTHANDSNLETYITEGTTKYRYIRFYPTSAYATTGQLGVSALQFYGRA